MRLRVLMFLFVWPVSAPLLAESRIPDKALCSVCALMGGETELEKVRTHSEHDGKSYYFCSKDCKKEFDSDPIAFLPPVFPRPAPAFVVETLEGADRAVADLEGKVVLLDFWATWCEPCLETMPRLQKLHDANSGKGLEVWGVSIDEDKNRVDKIRKMIYKLGISYPIFVDAKPTPAWYRFRVKAIPAMYLIDRDSQIVAQWTGNIDFVDVEKEVQRHIGKTDKVKVN
ncbi:MAG: redoxin domain-containing protein [Gemmatimonadetes bacterium]|nr:redoxin domain-containing protein [Gemmatimonadota bacterium]